MKNWLSNLFHSFSIQLLVLHLKKNILFLFAWVILGMLASGYLASKLGINYLFVSPEYMGEVGVASFFILGLTFGSFTMTWNLTCYMLDAKYFPFLATLARPFSKFCINNFIIPGAFLIFYLVLTVRFQAFYELRSFPEILLNCLCFLLGIVAMSLLFAAYFSLTNKDILAYLKGRTNPPPNLTMAPAPGRRVPDIDNIKSGKGKVKVRNYLTETLRTRLVRGVGHYDSSILLRVFRQNHSNAIVAILVALLVLIVLGYLIKYPLFRIPAGASIYLLMSIFVALVGAINFWFNEWSVSAFIAIILVVNLITGFELVGYKNKAYGLRYEGQNLPAYTYDKLLDNCKTENTDIDKANTLQILENWKLRMQKSGDDKPKMVFLCVSGGGLKTAAWAMQVLQRSDSLLNGKLLSHTAMISGASGGILGMAYLRELLLRERMGEDINYYDDQYIRDISKDLLNPVAFTIVSNDLFIPWASFSIGDKVYRRDRGYVFENQLDDNTRGLLNKQLADYRIPEYNATIPMMFITPSIVNDGRRLIISPQGASYMSVAPIELSKLRDIEVDGVDFRQMFASQEADSLRFLSALRMNATYPYILPNVHLPSQPGIEVMDAGFRDNFGIKSATRFIHVFKDWITANTSGVALVQISGINKFEEIEPSDRQGLFSSIFNPLGIATKIMSLQEYEHDTNLVFLYDLLGHEMFETIRFTYRPTEENTRASMTFHLTERELKDILDAYYLPENQVSLDRLARAIE
ncbi:MAG: patatin-like phospholipase family protein [Bacteroidia bacterium]|nr:patatin-like phospholipase family protein [Bacteroidia bacterium]